MSMPMLDISGLTDLIQKGGPVSHAAPNSAVMGKFLSENGFTSQNGAGSEQNIWARLTDILNSDLSDPEKSELLESLISKSPGVIGETFGKNALGIRGNVAQLTEAARSAESDADIAAMPEGEIDQLMGADVPVSPVVPEIEPVKLTAGGFQKDGGVESAGDKMISAQLAEEMVGTPESGNKSVPKIQPLDQTGTILQQGSKTDPDDVNKINAATLGGGAQTVEKTSGDELGATKGATVKTIGENSMQSAMDTSQSQGGETLLKEDAKSMMAGSEKQDKSKTERLADQFQLKDAAAAQKLTPINSAVTEDQKIVTPVADEALRANTQPQVSNRIQGVASTSAPHAPEPMPERFQTDIINQIVEKATLQRSKNQPEINIKLKPEFLGNIKLNISATNQQVMVKVLTDLPAVKEILETNLSQLRAELQQHGLQVDKFDVQVGPDSGQKHHERGQNTDRPMYGRSDKDAANQEKESSGDDRFKEKRRQSTYGRRSDKIDYFA